MGVCERTKGSRRAGERESRDYRVRNMPTVVEEIRKAVAVAAAEVLVEAGFRLTQAHLALHGQSEALDQQEAASLMQTFGNLVADREITTVGIAVVARSPPRDDRPLLRVWLFEATGESIESGPILAQSLDGSNDDDDGDEATDDKDGSIGSAEKTPSVARPHQPQGTLAHRQTLLVKHLEIDARKLTEGIVSIGLADPEAT